MPNTYACKGVSNPNVPIFLPRVCTLVLFIYTVLMQNRSYLHVSEHLTESIRNIARGVGIN